MKTDIILILDFGSQYTQLIARRLRELNVYCEIQPFSVNIKQYLGTKSNYTVKGVVLSGGPASVLEKDSPDINDENFAYLKSLNVPILGVCYGLQLLAKKAGGKIHKSKVREYGHTRIKTSNSVIYKDCPKSLNVWMSHGDSVDVLPKDFKVTAKSSNGHISSYENAKENVYALQFHPEVNHTENGLTILKNFVFGVCKVKNLFKAGSFIQQKTSEIKKLVGNDYVICALSGGVDSSVAAVLVQKAIGKKLICVHIDNGLMRKNESKVIVELFRKHFKFNLIFVDASDLFVKRLKGVIDPEKKRKIIGKTFIDVFDSEAKKLRKKNINIKYLVQGTLYPDVIESVSIGNNPASLIKTHHNVGGLPKRMKLKLIEPLRELFKDEVRQVGAALGLHKEVVWRQPFPGPGLGVRVVGEITKERLEILRNADFILQEEMMANGWYWKVWQSFAVFIPVKTVGVVGDERNYSYVIGLRIVESIDAMTADWTRLPYDLLQKISSRITNEVRGVSRVVLDISSKPPATIEWE